MSSKLEDILTEFEDRKSKYSGWVGDAHKEAKQAIKDLFIELIGEDEDIDSIDKYQERRRTINRNKFRSALRTKIEEL